MIDPNQLAFDIDGVVANTMQLFIDIARDVYGINHITTQDITSYHLEQCLDMPPDIIDAIIERIISGDYAHSLTPIAGAREVLQRLGAMGPILMVTARERPGPITPWMADLLSPEQCEVDIRATGDFDAKADVLNAMKKCYFVEDRLETCFLLKDRGITPVLFVQPWNRKRHPFEEVDGWDQLEELIDFS